MTSRERNMAILAISLVLLFGGGALGYIFVYQPISEKNDQAAKLDGEIQQLQTDFKKIQAERKLLAIAKNRSAPPDPEVVRREYIDAMLRLCQQSKLSPGYAVSALSAPDNNSTPLLAPKKPAYARAQFEISFDKADMWNILDFLYGYYQLDILHQISSIDIINEAHTSGVRGKKTTADRKNLKVKIISEVISLDGAAPRRSLLPIPLAFAAAGGGPLFMAMSVTPEAGRSLTPTPSSPVLASRSRDYSLIVQNDIFHGPLPSPPPLAIDKIPNISVEMGEEIDPVKIGLSGDLGPTGRVTIDATADGKPFPQGSLSLNSAGTRLSLTPAKGVSGKSEITVIAKTEDGQRAKTQFTVNITDSEAASKVKLLPDISGYIRIPMIITHKDGTAFAVIRDNFNPHTYELEVTASGRIKVVKYFHVGAIKKKDRTYDDPSLLILSDEGISSTKRTFRVVAVDAEGLIVEDLKPVEKEKPKGPRGKKEVLSIGPAAIVAGAAAMIVAPPPAVAGIPTLYRWPVGQSLKSLQPVPKDEAKLILDRALQNGPVGAASVASMGN